MDTQHGANRLPRGIGWGVFFLGVVFLGGIIFAFRIAPGNAEDALQKNLSNFQGGVEDLRSLNVKSAENKFSSITGDTDGVSDIFRKFWSIFGGAGEALSSFQNIASDGVSLAREIDFLSVNFFDLFFNRK